MPFPSSHQPHFYYLDNQRRPRRPLTPTHGSAGVISRQDNGNAKKLTIMKRFSYKLRKRITKGTNPDNLLETNSSKDRSVNISAKHTRQHKTQTTILLHKNYPIALDTHTQIYTRIRKGEYSYQARAFNIDN